MDKPSSSRPEYKAWLDMRAKCTNSQHRLWAQFGGRGVKVCPSWQASFLDFRGDMELFPGMGWEVGLWDPSGSFEPGNAIWVRKRQGRPPILGRSDRTRHPVEYNAWKNMKQACCNPNIGAYEQVGGKEITVHPEWIESFPLFLASVGPKPSPQHVLARVDGARNFEPGNVIWRSPDEAGVRHRRDTSYYLFQGDSYRVSELLKFASPEAKITSAILRTRLNRIEHETGRAPSEEEIREALTQSRGRNGGIGRLGTSKKVKMSLGVPTTKLKVDDKATRTWLEEQVKQYNLKKLAQEAAEKG